MSASSLSHLLCVVDCLSKAFIILQINFKIFVYFLQLLCLQVPSEEAVFEAVISWIKQDEASRRDFLPKMLQYVRLPMLTPRYLTDTVDNEVLIIIFFKGLYHEILGQGNFLSTLGFN